MSMSMTEDIPTKKILLQKILEGSSEEEIEEVMLKWKTKSAVCTANIKLYETYFKCINCSPEESHCICSKCFYNGNHSGHTFCYFNKEQGGTCDCGDPNLQTVISCKKHIEFSEKVLNDQENLISNKHRSQIEKYFIDYFKRIFQSLEEVQLIHLNKDELVKLDCGLEKEKEEDQSDHSSDKDCEDPSLRKVGNSSYYSDYGSDYDDIGSSDFPTIDDLFNEINLFIEDNPGGCLILSKIVMKSIPNFRCHHLCSYFADESKFDKFSLERKICTCSILKNLFRYMKCYSQDVEFKVQSSLCIFFPNLEFKKYLISVFSEMTHFLYDDFEIEKSSFYQLFCQFNSFKTLDLKAQLVVENPIFLNCLSKSLDIKNSKFNEPIQKAQFFTQTLSFFVLNHQKQNNWETNSDLPVKILKAFCSSIKSNNYGVFFIYTKLQLDALLIRIVKDIFKLIEELSDSAKIRIMGEIISTMLDQIVLFRKKDQLFQDNLVVLNECIELETQIFSFLNENDKNESIQCYVNNNLSNLVIPDINEEEEGVKMKRIITYKEELTEIFDKMKEIIKYSIPKQNFMENQKYQQDNKWFDKVFSFSNDKFEINRLTSIFQFSDRNQCPLFNNQYKIIALAFSQLYLQSNSIQEAKQIIYQILDIEHQAILEEVLLYSINQLSQTMEYVRHHQEKIMGFNDYQAIQEGLPGRDSDLVAIQNVYMFENNILFDLDVLALQTILPLVDSDKYFRELLSGFQLLSEEFEVILESKEKILKLKRYSTFLQWVIVIMLDRVSFVNSFQLSKNGSQKWLSGYIDSIINACFQFNNTYSLSSLKNQLNNLRIKEQVDIKQSLLSISKIKDNKFQKQEDLKFVFEPMMFLKDKKVHNMYYELLNESKQMHPEIENIVGNQFPQFMLNSTFAREIANQVCCSKLIGNAFMSIIKYNDPLSQNKSFNECILYTLKYISILLQLGQSEQKDSFYLKMLLKEDVKVENFFNSLKENKEVSKSIEQIDTDWKSLKQEYNGHKETLASNPISSIERSKDNEENEQNIARKKAKQIQMKYLQDIIQRQQKFNEKNKNVISQSEEINNQKQDCIFCHDSSNQSLEIIQAYIDTDNLDLYSNKAGRIPKGLTKKYIIQACSHISHFHCQIKNKIIRQDQTQKGKLCLQCSFQYTQYLPLLQPLLQKRIKFQLSEKQNEDNLEKSYCEFFPTSQYQANLISFQQPNDSQQKIIEGTKAFILSTQINNTLKEETFNIRVIQECICFILSDVYDNGLSNFLAKTKMISTNLFLLGRVILHDILTEEKRNIVLKYIKNIVEKNILLLQNFNQFTYQFIYEDANLIGEHSYQDLPLLYAQTIIYLGLLPQNISDQESTAAQILQLSEQIFKFTCISNANVILSKIFQIDQKVEDFMQNSDFLTSLNDQNSKWKDIITGTLLSIYSFQQEVTLKKLNDSNKVEDFLKIQEVQIEMLPFLQITSEIIGKSIDIVSNQIKSQFISGWSNQIKCLESPKFHFSEIGSDYFENYNKFFYKRCQNCNLFPRKAQSDLHLCLICGYQMCSNSCNPNENSKNLITHAEKKHEGKTIYLNLIENIMMVVDSPYSLKGDYLYFDSLNEPFIFTNESFYLISTQKDYKLNRKLFENLINLLISRQIPNKLNSLVSPQNMLLGMF